MSKNTGNTIEAEVMDHQFRKEGQAGDLGWSAHDQEQYRPDKLVMMAEEGDWADHLWKDKVRGSVLFGIFDACLIDFNLNPYPECVGFRLLVLAKFRGSVWMDGVSVEDLIELGGVASFVGCQKSISCISTGVCSELDVEMAKVGAVRSIFDYVLGDWEKRPDPADVGKKVLALAKFSGHRAVDDWSLADIAKGCGESKAATSARIRRMCNKPIEKAGGCGQARFQQGPDQRAVSAAAQKGNKNRVKSMKR